MKTPIILACLLLSVNCAFAKGHHNGNHNQHNNNYNNNRNNYHNNNRYGNERYSDDRYSQREQGQSRAFETPMPVPSATVPQPATVSQTVSGEALFQVLHDYTVKHTALGYDAAKKVLYEVVDAREVNGRKGIVCPYSQVFVPALPTGGFEEEGDANGDGVPRDHVNVEHIWPQFYFNEAEPMRGDLHHLMLTLKEPNAARSRAPFTELRNVSPKKLLYGTNSGSRAAYGSFEPNDSVKGNIARAVLYFVLTYHNQRIRCRDFNQKSFWTAKIDMFLDWSRQDPPDEQEKRRNDLIAQYQGNRNPFIDDPSLAEKIGADVWRSH